MKNKRWVVPVDEDEHEKGIEHAKRQGFDSVAAYIRWFIREDMKRQKRLDEIT